MTSGPPSGPSSMAASRRPPLPLLIIGRTILVVGLVVGLAAFAGPVVGNHGLCVADLLQLFARRWTRDARLFWAVALGHRGLSIMSTPRGPQWRNTAEAGWLPASVNPRPWPLWKSSWEWHQ